MSSINLWDVAGLDERVFVGLNDCCEDAQGIVGDKFLGDISCAT